MNQEIHYPFLRENPEPIDFEPRVGLVVKIIHPGERFWVTIKEVKGDKIIGSVNNNLLENYGYDCGDLVSFNKNDVFDIFSKTVKAVLELVVNNTGDKNEQRTKTQR